MKPIMFAFAIVLTFAVSLPSEVLAHGDWLDSLLSWEEETTTTPNTHVAWVYERKGGTERCLWQQGMEGDQGMEGEECFRSSFALHSARRSVLDGWGVLRYECLEGPRAELISEFGRGVGSLALLLKKGERGGNSHHVHDYVDELLDAIRVKENEEYVVYWNQTALPLGIGYAVEESGASRVAAIRSYRFDVGQGFVGKVVEAILENDDEDLEGPPYPFQVSASPANNNVSIGLETDDLTGTHALRRAYEACDGGGR